MSDYHHTIPSGQRADTVHKIGATSHSSIEDENDDEDDNDLPRPSFFRRTRKSSGLARCVPIT
jgi:hypothetical protein